MAKNVRVAINGFGRIGRLAFRQMFAAKGYEIVAINDLTDAKMLAHLLKFDSAQGRYALADKVEAKDGAIVVDGKEIKIYAEKNAADLPWKEIGVDVVLECTGFYTSKAKAQAHIDAGAKKVVISAPAGNDLPTIVYGVNEKTLTKDDTIISAASCTTNCLAPIARVTCVVRVPRRSTSSPTAPARRRRSASSSPSSTANSSAPRSASPCPQAPPPSSSPPAKATSLSRRSTPR